MKAVCIKAHFDGERIVLDEPFELAPNSALLVTVLPRQAGAVDERDAFFDLAAANLARAYGEDEPDYSVADLKEQP